MVRIEVGPTREGIRALMIDGYAPEPEEFEALPWREIRREKGLHSWDWMQRIRTHQLRIKRKYSESAHMTAYRNAVQGLRRGFCPLEMEKCGEHNLPEPISLYVGLTTGHTRQSIETSTPLSHVFPSLREVQLPVLQREYEHDQRKGQLHYIQNIIIYPDSEKIRCERAKECSENWVEALHFAEKTNDEYADLKAFTDAWSVLLSDIARIIPRCPFFWPLYRRLGVQY
jgi:hypothetical protein